MVNSKEDVNLLLNGKFGLKFAAESHIMAVKAVADAHFSSSIVALNAVFEQYRS